MGMCGVCAEACEGYALVEWVKARRPCFTWGERAERPPARAPHPVSCALGLGLQDGVLHPRQVALKV